MNGSLMYWIATALAALLFAGPAVALLVEYEHFVADMTLLGYPPYFAHILGISKLAAVAVILVPGFARLKEWAYAGMMMDVIGAIVSRLVVQGATPSLLIPIVIGLLVLASWALRPPGRKLVGPKRASSA